MTESAHNEPAPALAYYQDRTGARFAGIRRLVITMATVEALVSFVSHMAVLADARHELPLRYPFLPPSLYLNLLFSMKVLETTASIGVVIGGLKLLNNGTSGRPVVLICECAAMFFSGVYHMLRIREYWLGYYQRNAVQSFSWSSLLVIQLSGLLYGNLFPLLALAVLLRRDLQPESCAD